MNLIASKLKQKYAKIFPELFGHDAADGAETRNDWGVLTHANGMPYYEGELKNGKAHGYGIQIDSNAWWAAGCIRADKYEKGKLVEPLFRCCSNGTYELYETSKPFYLRYPRIISKGIRINPNASIHEGVSLGRRFNGNGRIYALEAGTVYFENIKSVKDRHGGLELISRTAEASIRNEAGQEKGRHRLPYGAIVQFKDGDKVKEADEIASWDSHAHPIITEYSGRIIFVDFAEGVTVTKGSDPMTGLNFFEVIEEGERPAAAKDMKPMIKLVDEKDYDFILSTHYLPSGIKISLIDGQNVAAGERLATFYDHDLPYHYKGEMKDGVRHGKGVANYINGSSKSGIWINGRVNGDRLIQALVDGTVSFKYMKSVQNSKGYSVVVSYFAEALIRNESGEVQERYTLPYGAKVYFNNSDIVKEMDKIAEWGNTDRGRRQIISEYSGYAILVNVSEEKMTLPIERLISRYEHIECHSSIPPPMIQVVDEVDREKVLSIHYLPYAEKVHELVSNNQLISAGDVLAVWDGDPW